MGIGVGGKSVYQKPRNKNEDGRDFESGMESGLVSLHRVSMARQGKARQKKRQQMSRLHLERVPNARLVVQCHRYGRSFILVICGSILRKSVENERKG